MWTRRSRSFGPKHHLGKRHRLALLLLVIMSSRLHGQATTKANPWPQRGWLFVGLGRGSIKESLAGTLGGSYSTGPLMFTVRRSGAEQLFGDGVDETAFLMGVRSGGTRSFVSAQLGGSSVHRFHTCDCSGNNSTGAAHFGFAFDVAAQANAVVPGIGLDLFGDLSPPSHRYIAFAVMVQLGWFGE